MTVVGVKNEIGLCCLQGESYGIWSYGLLDAFGLQNQQQLGIAES
jgi:hypothetical protein